MLCCDSKFVNTCNTKLQYVIRGEEHELKIRYGHIIARTNQILLKQYFSIETVLQENQVKILEIKIIFTF